MSGEVCYYVSQLIGITLGFVGMFVLGVIIGIIFVNRNRDEVKR